MKKEVYSKCGMRCDLCLLYRPNVEVDDRRADICKVYSKVWPGFDPDPKTVICDGCANTGEDIALFSPDCPTRKCVFEKGHAHCGYCSEYPCATYPAEPAQEVLHQKIDIEQQWTWDDEKLMEAYRCKHYMDEFRKKVFLVSDRLILRNVSPKDADIMHDYRNNEICARYQRGQTKDYDGIVALVERRKDDVMSVDAPFMVAVALKDTDEMVGEIVVMPEDGTISLGYTFSYKHHRKGYAFEALTVLISMLHERYPEWDFISFTEPENEPSMALLKKLGYKDMGYIPSMESQAFGKWTTPATEAEIAQATKNDFGRNCQMHFNSDIYYGNIIKGDLRSAISYVKQFPEQTNLYNRFMDVYEHEQYMTYEVDAELNNILTAYQQYYRDAFYLCIGQEQAANKLRDRLAVLLGIEDNSIALCDMEQNQLVKLFMNRGLHFMGGKSSGYYGPYIWRTTETVSYDVELPDDIQTYTVKLLDGFITRSWIDYLSFGEIGPGGWADGDGYINCVKSAWDFESESFRVSLLKHEAQHARDLAMNKDMSSEDLEYRAKLVELIYSSERNLLQVFVQESDNSDKSNGHAMAAYRIVKGFADALGVNKIDPVAISIEQIQAVARNLFDSSHIKEK